MAHPSLDAGVSHIELAPWKTAVGTIAAGLVGLLFIVSGVWKITDPFGWAARITQMQIPAMLAMPATLLVGVAELFGGVLVIVPRFRRWGAYIVAALLVVFMIYIGVNYNVLRGEECSCFPWLKRSVGPGFFIGDALMLLAAFLAWRWAPPVQSLRTAVIVLAAIAVFTGVSYGVAAFEQSGIQAPESVKVAEKPFLLRQGRVFVYFFDPECSHCLAAGKQMATYQWKDTRLLTVPTRAEKWAPSFMKDTGLQAPMTYDAAVLREKFTFTDPPYGVMLENGRQKAAFIHFDEKEPRSTLQKAGYIE